MKTSHHPRYILASAALLLGLLLPACEQAQQIADFVDSISDGAPCAGDLQCLGGRCLTPEQGYANGYCTTLQCEDNGCSGLFSECFRTKIDGRDLTACYELCNFDGTCARAAEGYTCVTLADTPVCLPPGVSGATVQGAVGSACSSNPQCNGEGATCLQSFFGGYCAILGCTGSADCPDANPCVALNPDGATDEEKSFTCMAGCASDDDCRFGYTCQSYEGAQICLEQDGEDTRARNPDGEDDGAACVSNINCKGGTCIREAENAAGDVSYPGGYCTTRDCDADEDCNGGVCITLQRTTTCRAACASDGDCRQGYTCREGVDGVSYCDSTAEPPPPPETSGANAVNIQCTSDRTLAFDIPDGAVGFLIAPYTTSNNRLTPTSLRKPDGSTLDIQRDYEFLTVNQELLGNFVPLLFPASDDASFAQAFGGGRYELAIDTRASEICYYVLPQMAEGARLKLNLYFVGVPGVTANSAERDADIQAMMRMMRGIYSKMNIEVEVAQYIDAEQQVASSYRIIRDLYDVFNLVATSTEPDQDPLSVNVFLIEDFNVSDAPGLLGISTGIPGMGGFHGSAASGLVFSTASLGQDNKTLGQTLAHEVGHYLGLRHTSEHLGVAEDPITDTPSCRVPDLPLICQDSSNFMFPFALGGDKQTGATRGQGFVLRHNPLVQ